METSKNLAGFLLPLLIISEQANCWKLPPSELNCQVDPLILPGMHYTVSPNAKGSLGLIGDVNNVINGLVTPEAEQFDWTRHTTGTFGFGAAAIGPISGAGEAIFVNGIAAVRQTDNGTQNYFQTITGSKFRTAFAIFIQDGAARNGGFIVNKPMGVTLSDIYNQLYSEVEHQPFCFHGMVQFSRLEGIAISKAPIYGEPLFGDTQAGYYTQPAFHLPNEYGFIFGCAANFSQVRQPELLKRLSKLLYLNPHDRNAGRGGSELLVHSHAMTLNKCIKNASDIDESSLSDVFHLLSNSIISFMDVSVFMLDSVDKLVEIKGPDNSGMSANQHGDSKANSGGGGFNEISNLHIFFSTLFLFSSILN